MSEATRVVWQAGVVSRSAARNRETMFAGPGASPLPWLSSVGAHQLFNEHQRLMHRQLLGQRDLGVMVFASCPLRGLVGSLWLRATFGLRSASIGRHGSVDLALPDDGDFSLRHSVVLVRSVLGVPQVRVVDLASSTGFSVGASGPLRAAEADGPFAMSAGSFAFFLLPTGVPPPWDPDALDPWATFPRVDVRETARPPPPELSLNIAKSAIVPFSCRGSTTVTRLAGPVALPAPLIDAGETPVGTLLLQAPGVEERLVVGRAALDRGIVVGRYARCNGGWWASAHVSRVHALVISVNGALHVVDTGSTNGTWVGGRRCSCTPLADGATVLLAPADGLALGWRR